MRLAALHDTGGRWGEKVVLEAAARGWETQLFTKAAEVKWDSGVVFARIAQHPVERTAQDKREALALLARGFSLVPDEQQINHYDSKLSQSQWPALRPFMPETVVANSFADCWRAVAVLGFPLFSKTSEGSASSEVRLLRNGAEFEVELAALFGAGITTRYAHQRGYAILQRFVPGNNSDMRVCIVGRHRMLLRRFNRSVQEPFASGSGKFEAITELDEVTSAALRKADECFASMGTRWAAIDLVRDAERWYVLETSIAYTLSAYARCVFFDEHGTPSKYRGKNIWPLLLDEIEAGVFQ